MNHEAKVTSLKEMVKVKHNRAEEVTTHSEEVIAAARLIRCGANRDLL
jgi:hypothetical protein